MSTEQPDPNAAARRLARELVRTGFETRDDIVASVTECLEDEKDEYGLDDVDPIVQSSVDQEIQSLVVEQDSWVCPTECDRLCSAFEQLKSSGILAQHHYTCCGSCGNFELPLHIKYESTKGRVWRGYTFYHVQDTESAVSGCGLCLSYGSASEDEQECVAIGREIANVLREHGFDVDWDGSIAKRISFDMEWMMPWPPKAPDGIPDAALELYQSSMHNKNGSVSFWTRFRRFFGRSN